MIVGIGLNKYLSSMFLLTRTVPAYNWRPVRLECHRNRRALNRAEFLMRTPAMLQKHICQFSYS